MLCPALRPTQTLLVPLLIDLPASSPTAVLNLPVSTAAKALDPTQTAVDYFTYTITDGTSTDQAEIQITVTGINDAPTSTTPATIFATENQQINIQTKIFFSDPDPSSTTYGQLTYSVSGLPSGVSINSNGTITVKDDGRGIPVDLHKEEKKSVT